MFLEAFLNKKKKLATNWRLFQYSDLQWPEDTWKCAKHLKSFWNTLIFPKTAQILNPAMTPKSVSLGTSMANDCMFAKALNPNDSCYM